MRTICCTLAMLMPAGIAVAQTAPGEPTTVKCFADTEPKSNPRMQVSFVMPVPAGDGDTPTLTYTTSYAELLPNSGEMARMLRQTRLTQTYDRSTPAAGARLLLRFEAPEGARIPSAMILRYSVGGAVIQEATVTPEISPDGSGAMVTVRNVLAAELLPRTHGKRLVVTALAASDRRVVLNLSYDIATFGESAWHKAQGANLAWQPLVPGTRKLRRPLPTACGLG